jgi:O-antigen ligase
MMQLAGRLTMDPVATREALLKLATDLILFFLAVQLFAGGPNGVTPRANSAQESFTTPLTATPSALRKGSAFPGETHDDGLLSAARRLSLRAGQINSEGLGPQRKGAAFPHSERRSRASLFASEAEGSGLGALRWTLVAYAFLLALFAIFQFFSSQGLIYWLVPSPGWTFGPYVNHNHYAGLMEMLIPLAIAGALSNSVAPGFTGREKGSRRSAGILPARIKPMGSAGWKPALRESSAAVLAVVILIPIASLLLSGSRGGFIAFLAEVVLAAVLIFAYGPRHARRATAVVGGGALLAAALLFFWMAPRHIAERLARLGDGSHPPEVELRHRLVAARDALGIWREHPWLGAGLGSFEAAFPRHMSFASDFRWDHAHNDYAEALAETGLAGAAAIACALALFFWLAFRNLGARLRHRTGWIEFAAALGCCGILVHSFADFNLHMPANAAWFVVCAAIATSDERVTSDK